jgi:murein peptide amidase A
MQRLRKNIGRYHGESIDIQAVLRDDLQAAELYGWQIEKLKAGVDLQLLAFCRTVPRAKAKLYISTGMHGDEPAGPLAVRQLLQENQWPPKADIWLCPCLNPTGFPTSRRENVHGIDLNRDYREPRTNEIRAHLAWLDKQPQFDLTVCLHEDWEAEGFYLYELNPDQRPSLAEKIINAVEKICPIDRSPLIDGREAHDGIIRPDLDPAKRPGWPEAFYLITKKTRHAYTLEAPSDYPLSLRLAALVTAVKAALAGLAAQ